MIVLLLILQATYLSSFSSIKFYCFYYFFFKEPSILLKRSKFHFVGFKKVQGVTNFLLRVDKS